MATAVTPIEKVTDPELAAWLSQDTGEAREILVDAVLPGRQVILQRDSRGRLSPSDVQPPPESSVRKEALGKLRARLAKILDMSPVVLESAGAVAIRANSRQVREFVGDPLVRAIRLNRKLRMRI
jgi:hypothetical protein